MDDKYEIEVQQRFIFLEYFVNGDRQKKCKKERGTVNVLHFPFRRSPIGPLPSCFFCGETDGIQVSHPRKKQGQDTRCVDVLASVFFFLLTERDLPYPLSPFPPH